MIARVPGAVGQPPVPTPVTVEFEQCRHTAWRYARRTQKNAVVVVVRQCAVCGANMGAVPKAGHVVATLPEFDDDRRASWLARRQADWAERHKAARAERDREFWEWYDAYLASPSWHEKRKAVLVRDKGVCQGCLVARATVVHHTTYARVGRELLIDLVSLCDTCHGIAHPDK